jgi:hypothetical protein
MRLSLGGNALRDIIPSLARSFAPGNFVPNFVPNFAQSLARRDIVSRGVGIDFKGIVF